MPRAKDNPFSDNPFDKVGQVSSGGMQDEDFVTQSRVSANQTW